jgi:hypothetical protein
MAATGFTPISLYYSTTASTAPTAGNLVAGELAINTTDGKLYYKDTAGVVQTLASRDINSGIFPAGTVSAPSITFIGDTNTGIYSPAADTIAFTEGGVEAMRIDSSGNVGIGTSSPATTLDVNGAANSLQARFGSIVNRGLEISTALSAGITDSVSVLNAKGASSGNLVFQTESIERMQISATGNVGIGINNPTFALGSGLRVARPGVATIGLSNSTNSVNAELAAFTDSALLYTITGHPLLFGVGGTERVRINLTGTVILQGGNNGANGTGITFPATQNQSSNANTLDDYEEGSWTPTITSDGTAPTFTYMERSGTYIKIGQLVQATCRTRMSITSGGTGSPTITGLPFSANLNGLEGVAVGLAGAVAGVINSTGLWFMSGTTVICATNGGYTTGVGPYLTFTVTYTTSS